MWQRLTFETRKHIAWHIPSIIHALDAATAGDTTQHRMEAIDAPSLKPALDLILALRCNYQCIPSRDTPHEQ